MPDSLPQRLMAPSAAQTLARFAAGLSFEDIPAAVLERAKLLILDALGCGLGSNAYDFADAALAGAMALGGEGPCSVIGRAARLPLRDAAMINGMLIHGLDFDDTHLASIVHPTAACLPTALTMGEALGVDGRALLVAYAAGMETAIRVGAAAPPPRPGLPFPCRRHRPPAGHAHRRPRPPPSSARSAGRQRLDGQCWPDACRRSRGHGSACR